MSHIQLTPSEMDLCVLLSGLKGCKATIRNAYIRGVNASAGVSVDARCIALLLSGKSEASVRKTAATTDAHWQKVLEVYRHLEPLAQGRRNEHQMLMARLPPANRV